jgi:hypothetical protein
MLKDTTVFLKACMSQTWGGIGFWACTPFSAVATLPLRGNFARSEKPEEVGEWWQ